MSAEPSDPRGRFTYWRLRFRAWRGTRPFWAGLLAILSGVPSSGGINRICEKVSALADQLVEAIEHLQHAQHEAHEAGSVEDEARVFVETVIPAQNELREVADELETLVADDLWPLPKYSEILFVR